MELFKSTSVAGGSAGSCTASKIEQLQQLISRLIVCHSFFSAVDRCLSFSHSTLQTFTGHVALILLDEHDFRLKRSNVINRAASGSAALQPFDTVVCAWSVQI